MNAIELENSLPSPEFYLGEALKWMGKQVYVKKMQRKGEVVKVERREIGYALIIDCHGFYLALTKPMFAQWIELKPGELNIPVMH